MYELISEMYGEKAAETGLLGSGENIFYVPALPLMRERIPTLERELQVYRARRSRLELVA